MKLAATATAEKQELALERSSRRSRLAAKNRVRGLRAAAAARIGARAAQGRGAHWEFRDEAARSAVGSRRYLQPEPLLQPSMLAHDPELLTLPAPLRQAISKMSSGPGFAAAQAKLGRSAPAYAYALNNPLAFVDPDGLAATKEQFCAETGSCPVPDYCMQNPEVCNNPPAPNKCEDPKAQGIITCPGKCTIYGGLAYLACKAAGGEKCALFAYKVFMGCMKTCPPELPN